MNTFYTEKNTVLFWHVYYNKGGENPFTGRNTPRGYYISLQREKNKFMAHTGLDQMAGAATMLVKEVNRQSEKQKAAAIDLITDDFLQSIADRFSI